jgi:signal transduction histidine kinase
VLREFALLAGIGTVATSLTWSSWRCSRSARWRPSDAGPGLALAVYAVARQWILNQMVGASVLTTERTFEQLYRVAREVQDHPDGRAAAVEAAARPVRTARDCRPCRAAWPRRAWSAPAGAVRAAARRVRHHRPEPGAGDAPRRHGKRIFTRDDARLAERVVDQVCRAVAYDRAVEQGRAEERQRIAQDLHDDIGARLLTLMYKAGDREMEEYIRHTLQDLKTLTRGLAASNHHLSHAAGEWKADLTQRLSAAGCA